VKSYDAIVVGGGIIGGSIALTLACEKLRVLLLDRAEAGLEASWAAAGMLVPGPENFSAATETENNAFIPFAKASFTLYPSFIEEIESLSHLPTGFRRQGAIELFFGPRAEQDRDETLRANRHFDIPAEPLSLDGALAKFPSLNREAAVAARFPSEATVEPRLLTRAVVAAAVNCGVELRGNSSVERLETGPHAPAATLASGEKIHAAHVVIAAGCFSSQIPGLASYAPTTPVRGQMLSFRFDLPPGAPVLRSQRGYIVPRQNGKVVAGSTLENAGYEKKITEEGKTKILNAAKELAPALAHAPIVEAWSGLRPDTPDHLPIIGAAAENLWIATGHYRNGILLAPATARAIAGLILRQKSPVDISHFSPLRFAGSSGTASAPSSTPARLA
jgi:glycine oxidase